MPSSEITDATTLEVGAGTTEDDSSGIHCNKKRKIDEVKTAVTAGSAIDDGGIDNENPSARGADERTAADKECSEWHKMYGQLVLHFEQHGNCSISDEHQRPQLKAWVESQRVEDLDEARRTKLTLLQFGNPLPRVNVCETAGCNLYAPFNHRCHLHFSAAPRPFVRKRGQKKEKVVFPLIGLRRLQRTGTYNVKSRGAKGHNRDMTRSAVVAELNEYLLQLSAQPCTGTRENRSIVRCSCMTFLADKPVVVNAVSNAILDYLDKPPLERKLHVIERLRFAEHHDPDAAQKQGNAVVLPTAMFPLPLNYKYLDAQWTVASQNTNGGLVLKQITQAFQHKCCHNAWLSMHNIGVDKKQTLRSYAAGDLTESLQGSRAPRNKADDSPLDFPQVTDHNDPQQQHLQQHRGGATQMTLLDATTIADVRHHVHGGGQHQQQGYYPSLC